MQREAMSWMLESAFGIFLIGLIWPVRVFVGLTESGGLGVVEICGVRAICLSVTASIFLATAVIALCLQEWILCSAAVGSSWVCGASAFYWTIQEGEWF